MDGAVDRVQLRPFSRLTRPDGFKVASISVDLNGNAIRLLVKKGSAGEFIAAGKPPAGNTLRFSPSAAIHGPVKRRSSSLPPHSLKLNSFPAMKLWWWHLAADVTRMAATN